jgi:hypothetical protein
MTTELALLLLQAQTTGDPTGIGLFRFFAAFFLIMLVFGGALTFTYWISKDE